MKVLNKTICNMCCIIIKDMFKKICEDPRKNALFRQAVKQNDRALANYLIHIGANYSDDYIHLAGKVFSKSMIHFLMKTGGAVNYYRLVQKLAKYGHEEMVDIIVKPMCYGKSFYEERYIYNLVIISACKGNQFDLMYKYININAGYVPLECLPNSVYSNDVVLVNYIILACRTTQIIEHYYWQLAMCNCCKKGMVNMLNYVIDRFKEYCLETELNNRINWNTLYACANLTEDQAFVDYIEELALRNFARILPSAYNSALLICCSKKKMGLVPKILENRISDKIKISCACIFASKDDLENMLRFANKNDITEVCWDKLFKCASYNNSATVIKYVLDHGTIDKYFIRSVIESGEVNKHAELKKYLMDLCR